ncbi:MAG: archease [Ignavibacterium album]|uniref:archease n=1 Tax=Ignavibacterium album TaxID=591197 RepID=UPI0026F16E21|nr:archease [Ignavibacterium album]MCX8106759.1 archease [Ignavibacterium album]
MSSKHTYLSHTADIAFDVEADSIEELFIESFNGWLNSVVENISPDAEQKIEIKLSADSLEQLLVDFLNEVNFLLTVKKIICINVESLVIDKENISLKALIKTQNLKDDSVLKEEIKSVTYHQMEIRNQNGKYYVRVVFDI